MKKIKLRNSDEVVWVDNEDFESLNQWSWLLDHYGYAIRFISRKERQPNRLVRMARVLMNCKNGDGAIVDHIDGNRLNNTKSNLRICDWIGNARNRSVACDSKTGFKGVSFSKRAGNKKWQVFIKTSVKILYVGGYTTKEDAARAYNEVAKKYHGEFARLNKI